MGLVAVVLQQDMPQAIDEDISHGLGHQQLSKAIDDIYATLLGQFTKYHRYRGAEHVI